MDHLKEFVRESNKIEGIMRAPTDAEIAALANLVSLEKLTLHDLVAFVGVYQPNAKLRATEDIPGVVVGKHVAPPSGPEIVTKLNGLLDLVNADNISPYAAHTSYEKLHPFTDGNGRSGRAIWLYQMKRRGQYGGALALGFLHLFYYQALEAAQ